MANFSAHARHLFRDADHLEAFFLLATLELGPSHRWQMARESAQFSELLNKFLNIRISRKYMHPYTVMNSLYADFIRWEHGMIVPE